MDEPLCWPLDSETAWPTLCKAVETARDEIKAAKARV